MARTRKSLECRLDEERKSLHLIEEKIAKYTELEAPIHLLKQRDDVKESIAQIEEQLRAKQQVWDRRPWRALVLLALLMVAVLIVLVGNVLLWREQPDVIAILRPTQTMETTPDVPTHTPTSHIPTRTPPSTRTPTAAIPPSVTVTLIPTHTPVLSTDTPTPTLSPTPTATPVPLPPTHTPVPPTPRPLKPTIYNFTAHRYTITAGESVELRWDLAGANVVYLRYNGVEEGIVALGNKTVSPAKTTVYTLVARNDAGETAAQLIITVNPATPTLTPTVDVAQRARVLFDEAHSEWASMTSNFLAFANDLRLQGYTVERHTDGPLTDDLLANFDILVVGTAWGDFTVAELDSIQQFVASGGGLFITGLGWSWVNPDLGRTLDNYPMNSIATRFGLRFLDDAICDPTNHYPDDNDCTPTFSAMAVHPIASGLMAVGGPISPSPIEHLSGTAQAVIFGDADAYSNKGYYSASTNPPVVMAVEYGAGRVVALGHEAYLGTTDCNSDGTPERDDYDNAQLGRNIIDWPAEGAAE